MVCQYLDDVCAAAPAGLAALGRFREAYRQVAEQVGVKLASEEDPDKAFAPTRWHGRGRSRRTSWDG